MVQGVKGPNLKQTRPAKFKLPVSYVDLESGEELQVGNPCCWCVG